MYPAVLIFGTVAKGTLLQKEGMIKQWRERWFELHGHILTIRKNQDVCPRDHDGQSV